MDLGVFLYYMCYGFLGSAGFGMTMHVSSWKLAILGYHIYSSSFVTKNDEFVYLFTKLISSHYNFSVPMLYNIMS